MNREQLLRTLERSGTPLPILSAMGAVSREEFVPIALADRAWDDCPLRLADGSTISQPAMVAVVLEELRLSAGLRVLEIGSGSGYLLALMASMGVDATGIEIEERLAAESQARLGKVAKVISGDGASVQGDPPYDRIVFSAALNDVPDWAIGQLSGDGFVLAPLGTGDVQELVRVWSDGRRERTGRLCRFVPFRRN